ncbi:MAG: trypsin-like peptidase domain-containing protein [Ilumatobacteraceae bacterium]
MSIDVTTPGGAGAGSGFIITPDGAIVTNAHVVANATSISVTFHDGSTAPAKVVGIDQTDDLAVVDVDRTDLPTLHWGTSADLAGVSPSSPSGTLALTGGPSATEGIISATNRSIDANNGEHLAHLLQTDAAINPGNSGGPLLALDGSVVGINSAGATTGQNIGFAIAADTAQPLVEQLARGETVTRAFLGVGTQAVTPDLAARTGLEVDHGLVVVDVAPDSGAADAGLQPGDVITAIDGTATDRQDALRDAISSAGVGATVHLTVDRNGTTMDLTATLSSHTA